MIVKSIVGAAVVGLLLARPCQAQTAADLLQKGIYTQDAAGDLDGAIRIYRQVLTASSPRRDYAAQAQSRIVQCLLKKGDAKSATREFDKLARDYSEFKDLVSSVGAQVRGLPPQRDRVQLRNGPTRILSAIRGTVTDDSGRPLRRAQIRLSAAELESSRTVSTDAGGHYEVTDLPAARYNLLVTRGGYLPLRYGQRRPLEQGKPLQLLDGEVVENVDFMLPRMSVIAGRINDETGEPIAGVTVLAMRSVYFEGRRQRVPAGEGPMVQTDDDGEYRVTGLVPGTYLVMAQTREKWTTGEGSREEVMGYVPTYFPGTTNIRDARKVTVGIGKEAGNTDFSVIPGRAASISGIALDSHGRPLKYVLLAQEIRGEGFGSFGTVARATTADDGRFTLSNITPGRYKLEASTLQAAGVTDGAPEIAILPIDVDGVDVDNVALTASAGGSVSGKIVAADSGARPKTQGVRIRIAQRLAGQPEPLRVGTFGPAAGYGQAELKPDGTFSIDHVFGPARFDITVPEGWAVKAVLRGGRDITDAPIELKTGERLTDVRVVITHHVTTIAGQLLDASGAPTPNGTVIVFAADRDKLFEDSRFVRAVRPDQKGRYQLAGLPPGDYLVAAVDYVEQGAWSDPEYLDSLRQYAQKLTLAEGEAQTRSLTLAKP